MTDAWANDADRTTRKEAVEPTPWWVNNIFPPGQEPKKQF